MFLDVDAHCKVLTPTHVIFTDNDEIARTITVSDARLGSVTSAPPIILSPRDKLDVAVLPLRGADDPSLCGTGRVSSIGIQHRILSMDDAHIEMMEDLATVSSAVRLRWRSAFDEKLSRSPLNEEGTTFSVLSATDRIVGGWSGSAVIDQDGTLLGMITDADTTEQNAGLAVAATALRYLLDNVKVPVSRTPTASVFRPAVRVLAGISLDLAHDQDQVFNSSGSGWEVTPANGKVAWTLLFPVNTHLHGISFRAAETSNTIEGVELASPDENSENAWLSLNYCPLASLRGAIHCSTVGTTLRLIRVTLKLRQNTPLKISGLVIEP
jgi:hypothetical protein